MRPLRGTFSRARSTAGIVATALFVATLCAPGDAMPVFAQRYRFKCTMCHTAIPELNAFGNYFRDHGYRLPIKKHGTTGVAVRYNVDWEQDPAPGTRRFSPSASILGDEDVGPINAYLHYGLGNGGAPASTYLGFLSYYNQTTSSLYRLGLYELPLPQSPGQRLDSISTYGYYATSVGLNDLDLNAPRLGLESERTFGEAKVALSVAMGEFKGAAYGGAPVFTGAETVGARPELELYAHTPLFGNAFDINGLLMDGIRSIHEPGRADFLDPYDRVGFGIHKAFFQGRLDLELQQFLGRDNDADGAGDAIDSSGGWARLKYFVTPHVYAAARYDTAANPFPTRTLVMYAGAMVFNHARIVIEHRNNLFHGPGSLGGYFIIAAPWYPGL